jgi:hypothetical protein
MQRHANRAASEIGEVLEVDRWARAQASEMLH